MGMLGTRRRSMTPARRTRIFEVHNGVCGYCHEIIEGCYEVDHAIPLALGGADDDGGNTFPLHVECHRIKTLGLGRVRGDITEIAKTKRIRAKRLGKAARPSRPLTHPFLVRSPDGTVYRRDGTEGRMR